MNNAREGITSQKTLDDNSLIFDMSRVSMYNQNMANTETNGIEAKIAPINELLFEISEIITRIIDETAIFTM